MAEKIISPGVFTRENDQSYLAQGVGEIGAAIIGPFKKGPAFLPTIVNTQSEFEAIFGTPDGTYYTGYTVQNYLRDSGTVTIVKVGHLGGYSHLVPLGIIVSGSDDGVKLISTLNSTTKVNEAIGFAGSTLTTAALSTDFSLTILGSSAVSSSILPASDMDIADVWGESPFGSKSTYAYSYFQTEAISQGVNITTSDAVIDVLELPTQDYSFDTTFASTPWIQSQLIGGDRYSLFRFHTLGFGTNTNTELKVSIYNVRISTTDSYPTFSVAIRDFDDTDKRQSVKQIFNSANLNPASPNYLAKLVGDLHTTIDEFGKITQTGDYQNNSKFVRVEVAPEGSFPIKSTPFAHAGYINPIKTVDASIVPLVIYSDGSDNNTSSTGTYFSGLDVETTTIKSDNGNYLKPIPDTAEIQDANAFSFDGPINTATGLVTLGYTLVDNTTVNINKRQFSVFFQEGFDGCSPTNRISLGADMETYSNSQGFDLSTSTSSGSVAYDKAINSVSNQDEYDINLVVVPGVVGRLHGYTFGKVIDMVESRQDAFFIGDGTSINDTISQATTFAKSLDSNYTGVYYPWVKILDINTNKLVPVPPSVMMPGIYAANDAVAAEWWAPAGLNRGGIVGAVGVTNRLTQSERDELYENKVNPIAVFPSQGISAFGQKTLQEASSALDRINVRRLLIKVKKYIASTSRYLVFEQNTSQTRDKFKNTVNPYLEGIQQRQGLYTFQVVMDESNNTPDVIDRNLLVGYIYLQPSKTAEFIVIDFNITNTGASFSG